MTRTTLTRLLGFIIGFALLSSQAYAGEAAAQIEKSIGAKIIRSTKAQALGLNAILAEKDGKKRIFYETLDGKYLFYGMVYDANATNLTAIDVANLNNPNSPPAGIAAPVAQVAPAPAAGGQIVSDSNAAAALSLAAKSTYVSEGKGKVVYVVFDPNCPYCKAVFRKTREALVNHEIRWIPVGVLTMPVGDSQRKAASIMRDGKVPKPDLESVKPVEPTNTEMDKITKNINILAAAHSNQVPLILWDQGGKPSYIIGEPDAGQMTTVFGK